MASIERYSTGDGTRYSVRYRTPAGSQTKKRGFKTKRDAELFLANTEVRKATGDYVAPKLGRATVGDLAVDWLERKEQSLAPATWYTYRSIWSRHVGPQWSAMPVAAVDQLGIETWLAAMLRDGVGPATVRKAHVILSGILGDAVKGKRISGNPARGVDNLPAKSAKRRVYLTSNDVAALATEAGQHSTLVLTLAYCGLRWGEATALRVRDIEFLKRRLSITLAVATVGSRQILGPPKTPSSVRQVPVPRFVLDALSVQCQGRSLDDLVFPGRDGAGFMTRQRPGNGWFATAVRRAGIQHVTPHDLRHTCASLTVSAGANVLALQRMLGHAKASETLDCYSDLFDSDLDAVATIVDERYAASVPKMCPPAQKPGF